MELSVQWMRESHNGASYRTYTCGLVLSSFFFSGPHFSLRELQIQANDISFSQICDQKPQSFNQQCAQSGQSNVSKSAQLCSPTPAAGLLHNVIWVIWDGCFIFMFCSGEVASPVGVNLQSAPIATLKAPPSGMDAIKMNRPWAAVNTQRFACSSAFDAVLTALENASRLICPPYTAAKDLCAEM